MNITTPAARAPEIDRDKWGRPMVVPPTGGPPVAYTRCTTFVGSIDDTYKLGQWQQRHAIRGTALHPDLIEAIRETDPENKTELDRLADEAKERSGAGDAARLGTYMHSITEAADRGEDPGLVALPWQSTGELDPSFYLPDLAAYMTATEDLTAVAIEQFSVLDMLKIGGTPDRIVKFGGKRYIADLKTGSIAYSYLKIAAQLAVYSRSRPYDVKTGQRLDPHGAETNKGIVIHLPAGTGTCALYWVDLLEGWEAVRVARDVRGKRSIGLKALLSPLDATKPPAVADPADDLPLLIDAAETEEALHKLWSANVQRWTDAHTDLAKARISALAGTSPAQPNTEGVSA